MDSNNALILIILSTIVLVSHFFNGVSKILRLPSVLLLISLGVVLKQISLHFNIQIFELGAYVNFLGALGLILIVLEGVLDLKVRRRNLPLIGESFAAALVILLLSIGGITALFYIWLKADLFSSIINAIPLAVISSAIVIPSIHHLSKEKRDFLTYESIFSDIIGIMLFNFVLARGTLSLLAFVTQTGLVIFLCILISIFLIYFIYQIKTKTKFFIILSLLIFVYAVGKLFHLSALLLVFTFGILLSNYVYILRLLKFKKEAWEGIVEDAVQFKQIIDESAFLIRTFFFIAFGYSINIFQVLNLEVLMIGVPIVLILLAVRYIYLNFIVKTRVFPELFIAPKGLITILLFYSIPPAMLITSISEGVLLFVILVTSLLMLMGGVQNDNETIKHS